MTHAGVLHHFNTKQNLLLETMRYRDSAYLDELGIGSIPVGRGTFDHLIDTAFRNGQQPGIVQAFVVLSAEAVTDDQPTSAYFRERYQNLRNDVTYSFRALGEDAEIDDQIIRHASAAILAAMDGLQYQWILEPEAFDLGPATKFAINAIVDSVLGSAVP